MLPFTPITEEQRKQFDEDGYLILRNMLDEETIARLIEAGDRLIESDRTHLRQVTATDIYDSFRNVISIDDAFIPLITHPVVLPTVVQLMGANLQVTTSHLIYRYPDPEGTPIDRRIPGWHRDNGRTRADLGDANYPRMGLKAAFYLTDLSQPNSGVTLMASGSHLLTEKLEIPEGKPDPVTSIEPLLNPGDCVIFEYRTWHAGNANLSNITRKAVMIGYGYRWIKPMDYVRQPSELVEKLDDLQKFLVGEAIDGIEEFQPGGGYNPLDDWCEQHGVVSSRMGT